MKIDPAMIPANAKIGKKVRIPNQEEAAPRKTGRNLSRKGHKYHAQATVVDGIRFASKREAKRYGELALLEKTGDITDLVLQPEFELKVNGIVIGKYVADFQYRTHNRTTKVVEDAKGFKTPVYRLKKRLVKAIFGIDIVEV